MKKDNLIISKKKFKSRLIVGTGKYKNMKECAKAIKISGADVAIPIKKKLAIKPETENFFENWSVDVIRRFAP